MYNLTKGIKYNVCYEYKGWIGNFSGRYLGDKYFESDNGDKIKIETYMIMIAIPC